MGIVEIEIKLLFSFRDVLQINGNGNVLRVGSWGLGVMSKD